MTWHSEKKQKQISIHALREEGDNTAYQRAVADMISIHALREEGDKAGEPVTIPLSDFYPRPPRGGRPAPKRQKTEHGKFLSTPSARRATQYSGSRRPSLKRFLSTPSARRATKLRSATLSSRSVFLSTPSARRATITLGDFIVAFGISIHALREEGDLLTRYTRPK